MKINTKKEIADAKNIIRRDAKTLGILQAISSAEKITFKHLAWTQAKFNFSISLEDYEKLDKFFNRVYNLGLKTKYNKQG